MERERRLAITVAGVAALLLAERVQLPLYDQAARSKLEAFSGSGEHLRLLGVFALGLAPFVSAFILVELVALLVPRWRALRVGGPEARARLERAALVTGVLFCLVQGIGVARYAESIRLLTPGWATRLACAALLTAGSLLVLALSRVLSGFGLGNGFSVLVVLPDAVAALPSLVRAARERDEVPMEPILSAAVLCTALYWAMRSRRAEGDATVTGQRLRLPISGAVPLVLANVAVLVWRDMARSFGDASRSAAADPGVLNGVALVVAVVACGWLFNRPGRVAEVWSRLPGAGLTKAECAARVAGMLPKALAWSCLLLAGMTLLPGGPLSRAASPARGALEVLNLALAAAVLLDLVSEWRHRAGGAALVSAWPEHRLYAVDPALAALESAGIPAHPRGLHHRLLLQFGGAFVPVDLLVPRERLEEAQRVLAPLLRGEPAGGSPAATP